MREQVNIDWNYEGKPDYSFGTGAYRSEKALGWAAGAAAVLYLLYRWGTGSLEWNWIQGLVGVVMALDIGSGLVCNSLNSCKRFYHSPWKTGEGKIGLVLKRHMVFSFLHVHPLAAGFLFGGGHPGYGVIWYIVFLLSCWLVIKTPLYLKRPVSMALIMAAVLLNAGIIEPVPGFEWLIPLLFMKIVYGHLVREEPYRKKAGVTEEFPDRG